MTDHRSAASLASAFTAGVLRHPERPALCEDGGGRWSYGELAARAWGLADELVLLGVKQDARVAILGERTVETVIAILGVLCAGGAYCVIAPKWPQVRRRQLLEDLSPTALVLADSHIHNAPDISCPVIRSTGHSTSKIYPDIHVDASALAYVLFTSGSTGRPKGVMVEHGSVLNMLRSFEGLAPSADGFTGALVAPVAFDVSVWEIFSTLAYGGTLHVPREQRLTGGDELWDYLCAAEVESAYIPPGLLPSVAAAAERRRSALRRMLVGVEPIPQGLIQRLRDACPGLQVVNGYGPTETTITATLHLVDEAAVPGRRVPIGRPVTGSKVEIFDERFSPVAPGEVGELVIFGECLARGYLNEANGGFVDVAGARAYRTGDYGRRLADGTIEFVGRTDGQLKVNGFRVEIGEVEAALNAMPVIRRSVVLPIGEPNARRLIAAVEAPAPVLAMDVRKHLADCLPAYATPSRIVVLQSFPLTANGKVDLQALLGVDQERPAEGPAYAAPETAWHRDVAAAWSMVLGLSAVGIDDDFHQIGGGSLDAVRIAVHLRERGYGVQASAILAARTIRRLDRPAPTFAAPEAATPGVYPALRAQEGLWTWREMNPESAATTVVHTVRLDGPIDHTRLERAICALIERHEALRTTFEQRIDGDLVQRVAPPSAWRLPAVDIGSDADVDREVLRCLEHRFDVRVASWTARLLRGPGFGALVFAADHLIFDGESAAILQDEIARLYDAESSLGRRPPGPASLSAVMQLPQEHQQNLRRWWSTILADFTDGAVLPEPLMRGVPDMRLQRLNIPIDGQVWTQIEAIARCAGTTPFVAILAALKAFLRARGGNPDNTVSIAVSRRHVSGSPSSIGNFVNLVPVRDTLSKVQAASTTFADYVAQAAERFRAAVAHDDLPFEDMISGVSRPPGRSVAAPARIVLAQRVPTDGFVAKSGLRFAGWADQPSNAIYDLTIFVSEAKGDNAARLEWVWAPGATLSHALEWKAEAFGRFLSAAAAEPTTVLPDLPRFASAEQQLIAATADPQKSMGNIETETLVSLFDAQAIRRPHAVALQTPAGAVTYAQLAARASEFASRLGQDLDGRPVVVVLEKSADQIAAVLAALKTGSPYLPLAPDHAPTRLPDLALRAHARACITDSARARTIELPENCRLVLVDALGPPGDNDVPLVAPHDLAYIMPTSGSTGPPKLVGVPHRAVVRLVHQNFSLPLNETDSTMLIANSSFDAATLEVWGALANGGRIIVPTVEDLREPDLLAAAIERHGVTTAFFTTTLFERMLDHIGRLAKMRHLIVGGEAVAPHLFEAAVKSVPRSVLVNGYGPTENTTFSCCFRLDRDPADLRSLPIGRPISGSGAIVVDEGLRPLPPGVPGEILVTGVGLATGYIDDPDLTRQRFVTLALSDGRLAYRTGDWGRLLPDGVFECLGRMDRQLKVRGFRIEPGEVETALSSHPAVRHSVAYAGDLGAMRVLLAAVEAVDTDEAELKKWLAGRLPEYLVPTRLYVVERLPMTPNGKLDQSALSQTEPSRRPSPNTRLRTALEHTISEIVSHLLGLANIGPDDDFFDLGANSMAVLTLTSRLSRHIQRPVPNHLVYSAPTVRSLAGRIESTTPPGDGEAVRRARDRAARIRGRALR